MQPKSIAEHKRNGTYRADRHGDRDDAAVAHGKPRMPRRVPKSSRWIWRLVVASYPVESLSRLDEVTLEALCVWWARWQTFNARLDVEPGSKAEYLNAMLAVASWKQVDKLAMRFGMSVLDRARLRTAPKANSEPDDPLTRLRDIRAVPAA
jgi:phage terminase small subunit